MRRVLLSVVFLALVLVALPLPVQGEETCRSGYNIATGKWECLEEGTEQANGLQGVFLALLDKLENAVARVLTEQ